MRTGYQRLMGRFEGGYGLLTGYAGKIVEELVQAVVAFEVVDQVAQRDAGSDEDRCPAQDLRVAVDDACKVFHRALLFLEDCIAHRRDPVRADLCDFAAPVYGTYFVKV